MLAVAGIAEPIAGQKGGGRKKDRVLAWVSSHRHKVGNVLTGRVVDHAFTLTNRSERPVQIEGWSKTSENIQVTATLKAQGTERTFEVPGAIAPGDEVTLHMSVDTAGLLGPLGFSVGALTAEKLTLPQARMSVRILPLFRFDPIGCSFGKLRPDERPVRELTLTTPLELPFCPELDEASVPNGVQLTCSPIAPNAAGLATSWKVEVAVTERPTNKTFPTQIGFDATLPEHADFVDRDGQARTRHRFELTVDAKFKDWAFAIPNRMDLGRCAPSCQRKFEIRVTDSDFELKLEPDDFRFESGESSFDWSTAARVEVSPIGTDTSRANLVLNVKTATPLTATVSGVLVVRVGHPDLPELRIPLIAHP